MCQLLLTIEIIDTILGAVDVVNHGPRSFIDVPGGIGKTFSVYETLYHIIRGRNHNLRCTAFTGFASILLPDGRTSHKTFGVKMPLPSQSFSNIKPASAKSAKDEAPMLPKYGLHNNMDQLLLAIGNPNLPFGGTIVVLLGVDFRQCLPVQHRSELLDTSIKRDDL